MNSKDVSENQGNLKHVRSEVLSQLVNEDHSGCNVYLYVIPGSIRSMHVFI